jgi:hypothetical protein
MHYTTHNPHSVKHNPQLQAPPPPPVSRHAFTTCNTGYSYNPTFSSTEYATVVTNDSVGTFHG